MSLLGWLHKRRAVRLIENDLAMLKAFELFEADPRAAAQNVVDWGVLSLPYGKARFMHPNVQAISWMVIYVLKDSLPRGHRLPYANAAISILRKTVEHRSTELTQLDEAVLDNALQELMGFTEQSPCVS